MKIAATIIVGLSTTLLLSGCFFAPSSGGATGGGTSGNGQSGQSGDGTVSTSPPGDVDLGDFQGLPNNFPSAEVPILDGEIPIGVDLGTGWSVIVKVDDLATAFAEASGKLAGAGFETVAESITADGSFGSYQSSKYQVQLTVSDQPDYGPSATYVVIVLG